MGSNNVPEIPRIETNIANAREHNFPAEIHIEPTNHCNKKCFMCPTKDRYKKDLFPLGYMDFDMYKAIIDDCNAVMGKDMCVNLHKDGEPLIHPQIGEMIQYAKSYDMFVHFATNGLLVRKKKKELVDSGLDLLTVSTIDDTAYKAITEFMKYKGTDKLPFLQIKVFDENTKPGGDKIGRITIVDDRRWKTAKIMPTYPFDALQKWKGTNADGAYIFGGWHDWTDAEEDDERSPCAKIVYSMAVTWEGILNSCCLDYRRDINLGIYPETSIQEAWDKLQQINRNQWNGIWCKPCNTCDYFQRLNEDETKITGSWK